MKLKINGMDYKVKFVDRIIDSDGEDLGRFLGDSQVIEISRNQTKPRMRATIIHEITHAFIYAHCLNNMNFDEEFICNFVEMYGEQILKNSEKVSKLC